MSKHFLQDQYIGVMSSDRAREETAYTLGVQAYLWGFPLCMFETTIRTGIRSGAIGLNAFSRSSTLKTEKDRFIPMPNDVTIEAYGAYDISREPVVLSVPYLMERRWYIVQMANAFDDVFADIGGARGGQPGAYAIVGSDFDGPIPDDIQLCRSDTRQGIVILRMLVNGPADVAAAADALKGFTLTPLSTLTRRRPKGPVDGEGASRVAVFEPARELRGFADLGRAMHRLLPASADRDDAFVAALSQIGLSAAHGFDASVLDEPSRQGLVRAARMGRQIVDDRLSGAGERVNGWHYHVAGGGAVRNFALRAALAKDEPGVLLSQEILFPTTDVDDHGARLSGAHDYVLHFEKGQLPPVSGFWNLALYGEDHFFVGNELGRHSIGSTTEGLKTASDGSVTLSIQRSRPGDVSNWLPAPMGAFNLTLRLFGPGAAALNGAYRLPAVRRVQ